MIHAYIFDRQSSFLGLLFLCFLYGFSHLWSMWTFYIPAIIAGLYVLYCTFAVTKSVLQKGWQATWSEIGEFLAKLDE